VAGALLGPLEVGYATARPRETRDAFRLQEAPNGFSDFALGHQQVQRSYPALLSWGCMCTR